MNELLAQLDEPAINGGNGHVGNGARSTGTAAGGGNGLGGAAPQARELTSLFLSVARRLLAADDKSDELPLRQLRVCMVLYEGPRSMSAISRELGVSQSAMTQIADRLERARLVKRSFEGADRRVRSLQLTPRGLKMMQLREKARVQRATTVVQQLPTQTRDEVLTALRRLLEACSAANGEAEAGVEAEDLLQS